MRRHRWVALGATWETAIHTLRREQLTCHVYNHSNLNRANFYTLFSREKSGMMDSWIPSLYFHSTVLLFQADKQHGMSNEGFFKCCIFVKIIVWKCFISILQVSQFWGESNQQSGGKVVDRAYFMCMVYFTSGYEVTSVLIMKTLSACDPAHCDSFFNSSTSPYFSRKSHIYHGSYFLTNKRIHANVNILNIVHSFDRMQLQ